MEKAVDDLLKAAAKQLEELIRQVLRGMERLVSRRVDHTMRRLFRRKNKQRIQQFGNYWD